MLISIKEVGVRKEFQFFCIFLDMEEKIYEVTSGDKVFPASEYQAEIFKTIEHGVGNLIINIMSSFL